MRTVGVRELKQNASKILADVRELGPCTVTVNGRPVATLNPLHNTHLWINAEQANRVYTAPADNGWAEELRQLREQSGEPVDPWELAEK